MKTISLKLPETLHGQLEQVAGAQGQTRSEVIRTALEQFLNGQQASQPGSFLEAAGDLIGCVEGPGDLSTNPKYMEGFGK